MSLSEKAIDYLEEHIPEARCPNRANHLAIALRHMVLKNFHIVLF